MTDILVEKKDSVAIVTINRPEQRNSVTYEMWDMFADIFDDLSVDKSVRSVIFTGAGDDFSVGADISEFDNIRENREKAKTYEYAVDKGCNAIMRCTKPVIAVQLGYTLGGGAHLAMSTDFRYAHISSKFGIPAANLSIVYGVQATRKLLSLVGLSEAKRILYSGQHFNAEHAKQIGFVDHVSETPLKAAQEFANTLARKAPLTQSGAKYILNSTILQEFDAAKANTLIDAAATSMDYKEGRAAFSEKRQPVFRGD